MLPVFFLVMEKIFQKTFSDKYFWGILIKFYIKNTLIELFLFILLLH